jgi:hypothetical protein
MLERMVEENIPKEYVENYENKGQKVPKMKNWGNAYIIDKPDQAHTEESPPIVFDDKQVRNFNVFHALPMGKCQLRLIERLRLITS